MKQNKYTGFIQNMMSSARLISFSIAIVCLAASPGAMAQWFADVGVESTWHDNLTRAERSIDAREDASLTVTASGGVHLQPGIYTGLTLAGSLNRSQFRRYSGLSNTELGLSARASHKFGLGEQRPILSAELGLARNEFNLGIRDAWIYRAGLVLQKRFTTTLNLSTGLRYEKRDGDHNVPRNIPVFPRSGSGWDLSTRTLFAEGELELGARTWMSAGYRYQRGEVVSSSVSYPKIFNTATAITLDPLYGPSTVAYRIPARTHILSLDLNRAVFSAATAYLGFELQRTHGRNGIDYESSVLRGGFLHSF